MTDYCSLISEYSISEKNNLRSTNNVSVELAYQLIEPVILQARAEHGRTDDKSNNLTYNNNQFVFGGKIYVLPYVILQPEYRILETKDIPSYAAVWTVQLHVFY